MDASGWPPGAPEAARERVRVGGEREGGERRRREGGEKAARRRGEGGERMAAFAGGEGGGSDGSSFNAHLLQVSFAKAVKVVDHTEYVLQVSVAGKTWQCQRRYRLFDELHRALRKSNPRLAIPILPEKRWLGNMWPSFVRQRQAKLQNYVDELLRDPRFSSSQTLRSFFEVPQHLNVQSPATEESKSQVDSGSIIKSPRAIELETQEEEMRRDMVVENAEKLMVEIYPVPPVLDATSAAEQALEIEDALMKRCLENRAAVSAYRNALSEIVAADDAPSEEVSISPVQEQEHLLERASSLIEGFQPPANDVAKSS